MFGLLSHPQAAYGRVCAAQVVPYTARTDVPNPESVIEQAFTEQERDIRPESVRTTAEYVEFGQDGKTTTIS